MKTRLCDCSFVCLSACFCFRLLLIVWLENLLVAIKALDGIGPRGSLGEETLIGWIQDGLDLTSSLGSQELLTNLTSQRVPY